MTFFRLLPAGLALIAGVSHAQAAPAPLLPERVLTCRMGHVTNFDAHREQTAAELTYDGFHAFALRLGVTPLRAGPPPDATEAPTPIAPRTRILADPDRIAPQVSPRFERVVDQWPQRVELSAPIAGRVKNALVITGYDPARGTANLFMMRAAELTQFDPHQMYQGTCTVALTPGGPHRGHTD